MLLNYKPPGPVAEAFMLSDARRRVIRGPFGSGKSSACVIEIARRAAQQGRGPRGFRESRWAVIRNTYQQLRDTTMATWFKWFPNGSIGYYKETNKTFYISIGDIRAEVIFRQLDTEDDVRHLLSLELTGAWVNEAREIPMSLIEALDGRINRFPPRDAGGPTWTGIWCDTNPPVVDTPWYYVMEGLDPKTGEPVDGGNGWAAFSQPSGLSPEAENLDNLPDGYYTDLAKGKDEEFVRMYIHGEYGRSRAGRPVHPLFRRDVHVARQPLVPNPHVPILIAADFGLTPAMVIKQQDSFGRVLTFDEIVTQSMGLERAIQLRLVPLLARKYQGFRVFVTGDPAGTRRSDADETTCVKIFRQAGFKHVQMAPTNSPVARQGATDHFLGLLTERGPAYLVDPGCRELIRALEGGYRFRARRVRGVDEQTDEVEKNMYSHIAEANQYGDLWYKAGLATRAAERLRRGSAVVSRPDHPAAYTLRT